MLEHVADELKELGLAFNTSGKLMELFHSQLLSLYAMSSCRPDSVFAEILDATIFSRAMREAKHLERETFRFSHNDPIRSIPKFHVSRLVSPIDALELLKRNVQLVTSKVGIVAPQLDVSLLTMVDNTKVWGNTLNYWIECETRNVVVSRKSSCTVLGTSRGKYFSGGSFGVLASKDPNSPHIEPVLEADVCDCRFHNNDFQLFCSSHRDITTVYSLPVLFLESSAIVLKLIATSLTPNTGVIYGCQVDGFGIVKYCHVRGDCQSIIFPGHDQGKVFVFGGRYAFTHESL